MADRIRDARRLVIKIGSALLVEEATGAVRTEWLEALADDVAALLADGREVMIVSSGAIAAGRRSLGLMGRVLKLEEKQAAAATGQIRLAHAYEAALARHGVRVAQILLTPTDTEERRRHLNARSTILQLLKLGAVPVINENDTVTTQEIRYGDNDRLAARVATMVSADTLILLTDIDGLYSADPRLEPAAEHIPELGEITPRIEAMAGGAPALPPEASMSTGGMATKLEAAKIALAGGCHTAIARGSDPHPIRALLDGARCTWFVPSLKPLAARKRWIGGVLKPEGAVAVDAGAARALAAGNSLLPAGVTGVEGRFERGDPVAVLGPDGARLGVGLVAYSSADARRIAGRRSGEIPGILGYSGRTALIHRDDLVLVPHALAGGAPASEAGAGK